jgi:patatin-like phospholipase/acyl hydrolase
MPKTIKILTIDGGGIRGIIPATILKAIEKETNKPISSLFDLIAGTSTGGIIALGLNVQGGGGQPKYTAGDLLNLYSEFGNDIFASNWWRKIGTGFNWLDPKYSQNPIEKILDDYFGQQKLSQTITNVLIPAYEIERRIAWFFKSTKANDDSSHDFYLKDVARATSAAPTYFPPAKISDPSDPNNYYSFVDGGTFANNPAMSAFVEVQRMFPQATQFHLVSLGTGTRTTRIDHAIATGWGLAQWAQPILDIVFDGIDDSVDYHLKTLMQDMKLSSYDRLQIKLDKVNQQMDNASTENIRDLMLLGEELVRGNEGLIERICDQLCRDQRN